MVSQGRSRAARLAVALVSLGCSTETPPPPDPQPLRVEVMGCAARLPGPVCVVGDQPLTVRVETPAEPVVRPRPKGPPRVVAGGRLYEVDPAGASTLSVSGGGGAYFALSLKPDEALPELTRLKAMRDASDVDGLRAGLSTVAPALRGRALGLLGRAERASGQTEAAVATLRAAIAQHRADGRVSDEGADGRVLAYTLIHTHHFTEARAVLDAQSSLEATDPRTGVYRPYYSGVLARQTGDLRGALRHYAAAERAATRIGDDRLARHARQGRALVAQVLGRHAEASRLLTQMRGAAAGACERAALALNLGAVRMLARDAGQAAEDPKPPLREAAALYTEACDQPAERAVALSNLAEVALLDGDVARARKHAADATVHADPRLKGWLLDTAGRIALAEARPADALVAYDELNARSGAGANPSDRWRAEVGRARALVRLKRPADAQAAFARAEGFLNEAMLRIPMHEGRAGWLGERERATRDQVTFQLDRGDEVGALDTVRRARTRALRSAWRVGRLDTLSGDARIRWEEALAAYRVARAALEAESKTDWQVPAAELPARQAARTDRSKALADALDDAAALLPGAAPLPPLPEGALTLAWFPLDDGWAGFAAAGGVVSVARGLKGDDPATLMRPFAARIAGTRRLRILPYGVLRAVDFHTPGLVPGDPTVVYGLDLGGDAAPVGPGGELVVADARLDLAAARRTAAALTEVLGARSLVGREATLQAVREGLARADLLHFAGHGQFAGATGWSSALMLADGRLTVGDVLALERVPRFVVLAGCETARSTDTAALSIGLAQAFALAGAAQVVASRRPVDDAVTAQISAELHAQRRADPNLDLAAALHRAQAAHPDSGKRASFRTLVR